MRKTLMGAVILLGLSGNVLSQGYFLLDNSVLPNRVSIDRPGNPYSGVYGLEVWMANNSDPVLSANLDAIAATNGLAAYSELTANGFQLETTFVSLTMVGGVFSVELVKMPDVFQSTVTVALAAWNSSAGSWNAAQAANAKHGLIAFVQPTSDYTLLPPPVPPDLNWTVPQDLVMLSSIPEPAAWALGLAGGAVILMLRRRKMH